MAKLIKKTALLICIVCPQSEALDKPQALATLFPDLEMPERDLQFLAATCADSLDKCKSQVPESFSIDNWKNLLVGPSTDPESPFHAVDELIEMAAEVDFETVVLDSETMQFSELASLVAATQELSNIYLRDDKHKKEKGREGGKKDGASEKENSKKKDKEGEGAKEMEGGMDGSKGNQGVKDDEKGGFDTARKEENEFAGREEDEMEDDEMEAGAVAIDTIVPGDMEKAAALFDQLGITGIVNVLNGIITNLKGIFSQAFQAALTILQGVVRLIFHARFAIEEPDCQIELLTCEYNAFAYETIPQVLLAAFMSAGIGSSMTAPDDISARP